MARVMAALDPDPARRPTDPSGWSRDLLEDASRRTVEAPAIVPGPDPHRSRSRRAAVLPAVAAVVVLALAIGALVVMPRLSGALSAADRDRGGSAASPTPAFTGSPQPSPAPNQSASAAVIMPPTLGLSSTRATTPAPSPSTVVARAQGAIAVPADRADVQQCAYFSGTASLPPGKTLILSMHNIDNHETARYVEYVFGWRKPSALSTWRGAQYFGSGNTAVGQRFEVVLRAVDLELARAEQGNDAAARGRTLVPAGVALASIAVHRRAPGDRGHADRAVDGKSCTARHNGVVVWARNGPAPRAQ